MGRRHVFYQMKVSKRMKVNKWVFLYGFMVEGSRQWLSSSFGGFINNSYLSTILYYLIALAIFITISLLIGKNKKGNKLERVNKK